MSEHTMENNIRDEGQLGAVVGVLGTVDQLIIDRSIMEKVKTYHRNLAVAFYDYKKAYDKVHHDWMLRVYKWIGKPDNVITLLSSLMREWKVRLEIQKDGKKQSVDGLILCVVYSKVKCKLLQQSKGYCMGQPRKRDVNCTHSLFVDDLKVYQDSHKTLKDVSEMIVQASNDTGACQEVAKCGEVVFEKVKIVKIEGLQVLDERVKTIDPDEMRFTSSQEPCKMMGLRKKK